MIQPLFTWKIPKRDFDYYRRHGVLSPRERYRFTPEDKLMVAIFGSDEERYWMKVHSGLLQGRS